MPAPHIHTGVQITMFVLTVVESEIMILSCIQSSIDVSKIQMFLKFLFRNMDGLWGESERDTTAVAHRCGPSLDWISIVVQLYRWTLWLQEGRDAGHCTR